MTFHSMLKAQGFKRMKSYAKGRSYLSPDGSGFEYQATKR